MKHVILAALLAAVAMPTAPALAQHNRHYRQGYDRQLYDSRGRYRQPHALTRNDRVWRGRDGRYYCRRSNGTTGLIVGAVAGGVLGNVIDGGRERTLGTLLGAGAGALLGRSVDRGEVRCR